jgi:hypothetical protein
LFAIVACVLCWAGQGGAAELAATTSLLPPLEPSSEMLGERPFRNLDFSSAAYLAGALEAGQRPPRRKLKLDLSPAIDEIFGFFRRHGIPLEQQRDEKGRGPVGVYADFNVAEDLPAVSFHLGDRPIEPLGAFYPVKKGFRCALVWPIHGFTLRIEGGEDSEFGYFGIAGVQWVHPRLPLAAGVGIPMNLRSEEDGDVGVIFQLRMKLN